MRWLPEPGAPVDVKFWGLAMGPILLLAAPGELAAEADSVLKLCTPCRGTYAMYRSTGVCGCIAYSDAYGREAYKGRRSDAVTVFRSTAHGRDP